MKASPPSTLISIISIKRYDRRGVTYLSRLASQSRSMRGTKSEQTENHVQLVLLPKRRTRTFRVKILLASAELHAGIVIVCVV